MEILKNISLKEAGVRMQTLFKRFPVAIAFIALQTIFYILLVQTGWEWFGKRTMFFALFYLPTAALMSFSFHLLNEEIKYTLKRNVTEAIISVGWLLYSAYLAYYYETWELADIYLPIVCVGCIFLSIFVLSFYHQKNDFPFWSFSLRLLSAATISVIIGYILTGGISLLFYSYSQLFGGNIPDKTYVTVIVICMSFVTPILFLLQVPRDAAKRFPSIPVLSKFYRGVVAYLFIPLQMCYVATLYIYALLILFRWELPNGWVSWLVTTVMFGMLAIIYWLYPLQYQSNIRPVEKFTLRWLPILIIPLLILMSIGIFRRIADYGITIQRLYLLLFNVWCYAVCLTLICFKSRRIWWIPASFGILALLASAGPWSIANITKRSLHNEVKNALTASGKILPMSQSAYDEWLKSLMEEEQLINSKLCYLRSTYRHASTEDLLLESVQTYESSEQAREVAATGIANMRGIFRENLLQGKQTPVPTDYSQMIFIRYKDVTDVKFSEGNVSFLVNGILFEQNCEKWAEELKQDKEQYTIQSSRACVVLNTIHFNPDDEVLQFEGILFTNLLENN